MQSSMLQWSGRLSKSRTGIFSMTSKEIWRYSYAYHTSVERIAD
jgi:hypothetical protein